MEKRFILAIVLSIAILLLWQTLFVKKPSPAEISSTQNPPAQTKPVQFQQKKTVTPSEQKKVQTEEVIQSVEGELEKNVIVETSLYRAIWSNKGAVLKSWSLKEHLDQNKEPLELINNLAGQINVYPFFISSKDNDYDTLVNNSLYQPSQTSLKINDGEKGELLFVYADQNGNKVEKKLVFNGGSYDFDIKITTLKNHKSIDPHVVWGPSFGNLSDAEIKKRLGGGTGIAIYPPQKVARMDERKYDPLKGTAFNYVQWAAYENNYFAAIFITDPQKSSAAFIREETNQVPAFYLEMNHVQKVHLGPKNFNTLEKWGFQTKKILKFGLFGFISEILYKALHAIKKVIPNWGFAIIILTILIKILFFPLTYSSTKSMSKMQELQPRIKALRSKYKKAKKDIDQRRKMNEEMMALYKTQGVNPAGGCLPLLIQIPIFWGFFRLLSVAVEFRHAPFMLWIKDLSVMDPLYIIPVLMGITQFISQKMTPSGADPSQQKMMLMMPVIMTVFFLRFQSGLVLYWLTNNVLQIGQQYIMNRMMKKKKKGKHGKRRKK